MLDDHSTLFAVLLDGDRADADSIAVDGAGDLPLLAVVA